MDEGRRISAPRLGWTYLKMGAAGFGGLAAVLALVEQALATRQGILDREEITESLTCTKPLPGSTVVQVVAYLGWRLGGWSGSAIATACFVAAAAAVMIALAALCGRFAQVPDVGMALRGMGAAVVGLLLMATWRLGKPNLKDLLSGALAVAAPVASVRLEVPPGWIVVIGGLIGVALGARRRE